MKRRVVTDLITILAVIGLACTQPEPTPVPTQNSVLLPGGVSDALDAAGIGFANVPPGVVDALISADQLGLLQVIPPDTTENQNLVMQSNAAVVLGEGSAVNGNIEGRTSNIVVAGNNSRTGNIIGVGISFFGGSNVEIDGNAENATHLMLVGPGAQVHLTGNVQMATIEIEEAGAVTIDGNLTVGTSLYIGPNSFLTVGGNVACDTISTARIDSLATIAIGVSSECPALP